MTLRITAFDRYVDLGRGPFGIAGWGHYLMGRYTVFAVEVER